MTWWKMILVIALFTGVTSLLLWGFDRLAKRSVDVHPD